MCSYVDLVAGESYIQVNRKLVNLAGLAAATYWAEILDIAIHVIKKSATDKNGYWKIDREYVTKQIGLSEKEQISCDAILSKLGLLAVHPDNCDKIGISVEAYTNLIVGMPSTKTIPTVNKIVDKKENIIRTMKSHLSERDPELLIAYENWVDSVYGAKRFLTFAKIELFEDTINKFTTDKKTKLSLIQQGIISGYDNADWIINAYKRPVNSGSKINTNLPEQKVAKEVSKEWEF